MVARDGVGHWLFLPLFALVFGLTRFLRPNSPAAPDQLRAGRSSENASGPERRSQLIFKAAMRRDGFFIVMESSRNDRETDFRAAASRHALAIPKLAYERRL
jgi:hypothetical protein